MVSAGTQDFPELQGQKGPGVVLELGQLSEAGTTLTTVPPCIAFYSHIANDAETNTHSLPHSL